MKMDPEALYVQLGRLVAAMPPLNVVPQPTDAVQWIARAIALAMFVDDAEAKTIKSNMDSLWSSLYRGTDKYAVDSRSSHADAIVRAIYRVLARAEVAAPAAAQGAFIPAGNAFDAMAAVGKVLGSAKQDLLIIDPYMDEKVLTDFAAMAAEGVTVRLLADQQSVKQTLKPAAARWTRQYQQVRPMQARLAAPRSLHDRLIVVDKSVAWVLTQSFNAFAARSPASIIRADDETAALKVAYYEAIWNAAPPV